eukprot:2144655-Rhodomonas_salina.1
MVSSNPCASPRPLAASSSLLVRCKAFRALPSMLLVSSNEMLKLLASNSNDFSSTLTSSASCSTSWFPMPAEVSASSPSFSSPSASSAV